MLFRLLLVTAIIALPTILLAASQSHHPNMDKNTLAFIEILEQQQKSAARMEFGDSERKNWSYIPRSRRGIALKSLSDIQQQAAFALLRSGLSSAGYEKARKIMNLEAILAEIEGSSYRDPLLYFLSIFGNPSEKAAWGWRFEGHHLSLNFTIVDDRVSVAPNFWGANPARVPSGPHKGLRTLKEEEDRARSLLLSLDDNQMKLAVVSAGAPSEISTGMERRVTPLPPQGLGYAQLTDAQRHLLFTLLDCYLDNFPEPVKAKRRQMIEQSDLEAIRFSWHGGIRAGERHYYRIQGQTFLVEYDNFQNQANHIHAVWRDFDGDFGRDLLREHLASHPH